MGSGDREVEEVPGLSEPEEEPLPLGGVQDELRPTPAEDVPAQGRGTLAEDRVLRVETDVMYNPIQNIGRKRGEDTEGPGYTGRTPNQIGRRSGHFLHPRPGRLGPRIAPP